MELIRSNKILKFDGEIKFSLKELGKLYKSTKDISELVIEWLLNKHNVPDGMYLLAEQSSDWKRIIIKSGRKSIKFYRYDIELFKEEVV